MRDARRLQVVATCAMTVAVTLGFVRVFDSPAALLPLVSVAVVGHIAAAVTRRLPAWLGWLTMVVLGALVCIDLTHWASVTWGLPTPSTFEVISAHLNDALVTLRSESAPVPQAGGIMLVAGVAIWLAAWSTDRLAFRFHAQIEAIVPNATIFVVVTALAGDDHRWITIGVFAGAVALHLLTARHLVDDTSSDAGAKSRSFQPILRGLEMVGCALLVGLGATAQVPALQPEGVLPLRPDNSIVVSSPLIDMRDNLGPLSDRVMFTVTSSNAHYWRLTALDDFDGNVWSPQGSANLRSAGSGLDVLPATSSPGMAGAVTSSSFDIVGLGGNFAPAPFQPVAVDDLRRGRSDSSASLVFQQDTSTLIASKQTGDVQGLSYRVDSQVPGGTESTPEPEPTLDATMQADTALPAALQDALQPLATKIVRDANATNPVDQARAIQDFFSKDNGFRYDLEARQAPDGSGDESTEAILAFLDASTGRRGFCVQYAGTYAALARSIGLPTRLAVGFIPGEPEQQLTHDLTFTVRGRDAHTWPEVFIADLGWIAFEPTPGRGNPDTESFTGRAEILTPDEPARTDRPRTSPTQSTTVPTSEVPVPTSVATSPIAPDTPSTPRRAAATTNFMPGWRVFASIGLVLAVCSAGPILRIIRRRRRRRAARTPSRQVRLAWTDTLDAWFRLDVVRTATDTDRDLGDRIAQRVAAILGSSEPGLPARRLAELASIAAWNDDGVTALQVDEAVAVADDLTHLANSYRSSVSKILGVFDPRYRGGA